jgi:hypothetical protein
MIIKGFLNVTKNMTEALKTEEISNSMAFDIESFLTNMTCSAPSIKISDTALDSK